MSKLFNWAAARLVAAFAFALPLAALAVDYTGTDYAPWSYSKGCIVWRATSGQLFHVSTVADVGVDEEGKIEIGDTYNFGSSGHPWQVFAKNQSQYDAPGKVLVFDEAGYNNNSDAQFAPFDFGGMWVRALQAENTPYCITDSASGGTDRTVYLGASSYSTYFRFDKSFTFDRNSQTKVMGVATVEIAEGATFKINARASKGAAVDVGNTLVMKGNGVLDVGSGLSVSGTLDLSATTVPTIDGDVTLIGESTIVLPAGTELPYTVCTGTLSAPAPVLVKIGDAEAEDKSLTVSGGAITAVGEPNYVFTDNYPTTVPLGKIYTFVGGETAESAVTVPSTVNVSGTLKTSGFITVPYYAANTDATLDVIDGTTTLNCGSQAIKGVVTVRENATLVNTTTDAITYGTDRTVVNVYGTVSMGNTRWSLKNTAINMYGGMITGDGQETNGALDFLLEDGYTGELNAYATSTISASIKFRNTLVPVTVEEGAILTLSGVIRTQTSAAGVTKKGVGNLTFSSSPTFPAGIVHENGHLVFSTEDDVNLTTTYTSKPSDTTSLWYARQSNWKGTVVLSVLSAPTALPLDTYGNANSKIVLKGATGNCYLDGTTTVPAEVVIDTDEDHVVEFNNGNSGQVGTFSKISGAGTLKLTAWGGCSGATYNLNTISNFTGTLAINNGITRVGGGTFTVRIGNILTTRTTNPGDCVLPIVNTAVANATGTVVYDLANTTVNGNALDLEAKADGIYVVVPTVTITVPAVANTTVSVVASEGDVVDNGDGTYTVAAGSVVTVTYVAADGYAISGKTEYTIDTATATTFELDESTEVAQCVARVRNTTTNQDDKFTSLAAAVAATGDGSHASQVVLLANVDEDTVTVSTVIMLMGNYIISSGITVSNGGALQVMQPTLAGTLTIEDGGTYVTSGGSLASVVAEDGAIIQLTTLSTETPPLSIANLTVEGDLTVVASWFGATRGTDYKAISYLTANAILAQGANIDGAAEWSADSYTDGNNTIVTLAITAVATVDGVYYDDAQDAVDAAVASGEPVSFLVAPGTVTLGAGETLVVSGATLPTVVLEDGLTTPPYEIEHTIDAENLTNTYAVKAYVAQITRSEYSQELGPQNVTYKFESIAEAVENANADETIKVIADNTMTGNAIAFAKSLTLDLNGFTTTHMGDGHVFEPTNGATFTITDTSDGAAGKVVSATKIILSGSPCTVTINAGTLDCGNVPVYLYDNSSSVVNVNGGKLVCRSGTGTDSCIMNNPGTINMTAGVIESSQYGFQGNYVNVSGGTVNVNTSKGVFRLSHDQRASGGTFNMDVSEYCVSGKICVPNGDGTYTVRAGTWIAQVGSTKYESLAAAVGAAEAGDTITLLADDRVSFTEDNLELSIDKALTINGAGYTIYGVNAYAGGKGDHDIYISGSGDVTIKNVTLAEFGGAVANNMRTYPIWTGSAYTGTLTLDNVTVRNFNRTAFNLNGGTVVVKDCTITGDKSKDTYFQSGIEAYNANVTVQGTTTITGTGSNLVDWPEAACLQLGNPNGSVAGTGSITVTGGTFTGDYGIIVASNASEVVSVTGGTFNGVLEVEDGEGGSLTISGGTFNAVVPDEYLAEGYEVLDNGDGTYGVREDKGWIYAAPGYWNYTGTWSEGATLGEEKVTIEDGATYTASEASDGRFVTVAMTLSFDDANDDDDDFGDAKAAIRLASGETDGTYQFQLYTSDGANNVWTNATVVGVTATKEVDYNFVIVLDLTNKIYTASVVTDAGATTNALTIGENVTEIPFACQGEITPVQQIDFVGAGKVSSIEGSYETPEEPPAPEGFDEDDTIGEVTLTAEQATWLNGQNNYDELATKIATMTADAFNNAYLLNLNITGEFSYEFTVTNIEVGDDDVTLTVSLTRTGTLDETTKINGTVALTGTDELGKEFTTISEATVADEDFSEDSTTTITLDKGDAKFFQPVIK